MVEVYILLKFLISHVHYHAKWKSLKKIILTCDVMKFLVWAMWVLMKKLVT